MQEHRFERFERLVGRQGLQRLGAASVAVVGVGGVGSYAAEALVRAGLGRLTLIDFDRIVPSNINRQVHALEQTVGQLKVEAMAARCRNIHPAIQVFPRAVPYDAGTAAELLEGGFDYLCDCIDGITAKLHLIESCRRRRIPIISSMGAANKLDPTLIRVGDLAETRHCRMARVMRRELGRRGIRTGVKVVYSLEEFHSLDDNRPHRETAPGRRPRITLGSSSYIPPLFGLTLAGAVIRELLKPMD